jgi:hypothetical protein
VWSECLCGVHANGGWQAEVSCETILHSTYMNRTDVDVVRGGGMRLGFSREVILSDIVINPFVSRAI